MPLLVNLVFDVNADVSRYALTTLEVDHFGDLISTDYPISR